MHLYVHIPFCPKVCPYCSFYKEASDRNRTQAFLDAVLSEASNFGNLPPPTTVFFGGGTPSALSTRQLDYLLTGLHGRFDLTRVKEWTLEMNPATVSLEKARLLLSLGVNRISMGVQSWDEKLLQVLGRVHDSAQARRSYEILREAGVPNINLDLIYGIPGQTREQWIRSLEETIALEPNHISAYCLTYEEDTDFFLRLQRGEFAPDEAMDADLFELTVETLAEAGYPQYEISNYSPEGSQCLHNLAYWNGSDYLGLGPSAFSTIADRRWRNVASTEQYIAAISEERNPADFEETLTHQVRTSERLAFGLRTASGVPIDLLSEFGAIAQNLRSAGYLELSSSHARLTPAGRLLADEIAAQFM